MHPARFPSWPPRLAVRVLIVALAAGCGSKPGVRITDREDKRLNEPAPLINPFEGLGAAPAGGPAAPQPAPGAPGGPPSVESLSIATPPAAGAASDLLAGTTAARLGGVSSSGIDLDAIPNYSGSLFEERKPDLVHMEKGTALFKQNKLDEAIVEFDRAVTANPQNALAYEDLGLCYAAKNDVARATANFDAAIRLNPKNPAPRVYRGTLMIRQRFFTQAVDDLNVAVEIDPKNVAARLWRGVARLNLRLYADAIADASAAIDAAPGIPDGYYIRCLAYLQSGEFEKGRADFAQASQRGLDPQARQMIQEFLDTLSPR